MAAPAVHAQLSIDVGNLTLPDGVSGNTIVINVDNAGAPQQVGALDFYVQIDTGGPKISTATPPPYGVDIKSGTVFASNDNGPTEFTGSTQYLQGWEDFSLGTPSLTSGVNKVATITLDTTGVAPGVYNIKLANTDFATTSYTDPNTSPIPMTVVNGTITVVPEPNAAVAIGSLLLGLAGVRYWRCRT